ncbi:hypothetical protein PMIN06_010220 [Paraphaeosphaeria minitans]
MPTGVHEPFIDGVKDAIQNQLKTSRDGSDRTALCVKSAGNAIFCDILPRIGIKHGAKIRTGRFFLAQCPGITTEVAYSQKRNRVIALQTEVSRRGQPLRRAQRL